MSNPSSLATQTLYVGVLVVGGKVEDLLVYRNQATAAGTLLAVAREYQRKVEDSLMSPEALPEITQAAVFETDDDGSWKHVEDVSLD